jgi:hypothetical protein
MGQLTLLDINDSGGGSTKKVKFRRYSYTIANGSQCRRMAALWIKWNVANKFAPYISLGSSRRNSKMYAWTSGPPKITYPTLGSARIITWMNILDGANVKIVELEMTVISRPASGDAKQTWLVGPASACRSAAVI